MHVTAIIPAAGRSERFGTDKLGQDLGGRPLLMRTVELFTKRSEVRQIIVAGPPDDSEAFRARFGAPLGFHGVIVVDGGRASRSETVRAALAAVSPDATHIAVHDAARPAASTALLDRVFKAAGQLDAVVPGLPVSSTVKRVEDAVQTLGDDDDALIGSILGDAGALRIEARRIAETVERANLFAAQTPQVFAADLLRAAYEQTDLEGVTDDAQVVERFGSTVHIVEGDPLNIKVTRPGDLALVHAVLGLRTEADRPAHKRF